MGSIAAGLCGGSPEVIWALRRGQRVIKLINILRFKRRAIVVFKLGYLAPVFPLSGSNLYAEWINQQLIKQTG